MYPEREISRGTDRYSSPDFAGPSRIARSSSKSKRCAEVIPYLMKIPTPFNLDAVKQDRRALDLARSGIGWQWRARFGPGAVESESVFNPEIRLCDC